MNGSAGKTKLGCLTFLGLVLAVGLILSYIGSPPPEKPSSPPPPRKAPRPRQVVQSKSATVALTMDARLDGNMLIITGTTDLPDGTLIAYEVQHDRLGTDVKLPLEQMLAEGNVKVSSGKYSTTIDITEWPEGNIRAWVAFQTVLATDVTQPQSIIERFGESGENLQGSNISSYGTFKRVELERILTRGEPVREVQRAKPQPVHAKRDIQSALNAVMQVIEWFNDEADVRVFTSAHIKQGGRRLELMVSDDWYPLPQYQKERLVELLADKYALIAANHGLRGEDPSEANYPTTSLLDSFGKEVAYKSTWRTKVLQ